MSARLRVLFAACPYLFLVMSLSAGLFLAWAVPPFQNADELAHVHRADLLTLGRVIGERVGTPQARVAGGMVHMPFGEAAKPFVRLQFHPDEKVRAADFEVARQARFDGRIKQTDFPGSAPYPPVFYLPATAAFALGQALDWSILDTLFAARAAMTLACALIGFVALRTAGRARLPLYALLLLPMSVSLASAVTCDGMLLATTALGVALVTRAMSQARAMTAAETMGAAICFALIGAAKPPYAVFCLTLLFAPGLSARLRLAASLVAFGIPAAWSVWMNLAVRTLAHLPGTHIDPQAQFAGLLAHPQAIFAIAWRTIVEQWDFYARSFVGVLGWLDTDLPAPIYPAALAVVALAFALSPAAASIAGWRRVKVLAPLQIALAGGGVFLSMYLLWTDVGLGTVNGVQGRYLLPLALFAALLVEGDAAREAAGGRLVQSIRLWLVGAVLAFPALSLALAARAVVQRYYIG